MYEDVLECMRVSESVCVRKRESENECVDVGGREGGMSVCACECVWERMSECVCVFGSMCVGECGYTCVIVHVSVYLPLCDCLCLYFCLSVI